MVYSFLDAKSIRNNFIDELNEFKNEFKKKLKNKISKHKIKIIKKTSSESEIKKFNLNVFSKKKDISNSIIE